MGASAGERERESGSDTPWWAQTGDVSAARVRRSARPRRSVRPRGVNRRSARDVPRAALPRRPAAPVGPWPARVRRLAPGIVALGGGLLLAALVALALAGGASADDQRSVAPTPPGVPRATVSATAPPRGQQSPAIGGPGPGTGGPGVAAAPPLLPPIGPIANPLDPERWTTWAKELFGALTVEFFKGILDAIRAIVGALFGALGTDQNNLLIPIPAALTYDHPVVRQYQGLLIGAANAGLVCVLALGGINVILKDRIGATYHDAMELLPRFMLGVAFINLARRPGELLIEFTNAAIAGVGVTGAPGWGALPTDVRTIGDVLLAIFYLVAMLCLVLQIYLRLVLVDLLLILTPLALLAWILPQTQEIARRWTNAFVSVVLTFFVQSLALKVGAALLQGGLAETSGPGALASLFLSGAFFVLLFRLPGLVSQQIGSAGTVGRVLLARTLLGGAARGGGRPPGTTAAIGGGQSGGLGGGRAGTLAATPAGGRP